MLLVVRNALDRSELQRENQQFRDPVGDGREWWDEARCSSAPADAARVAKSDAGVLLTGESAPARSAAAPVHRESRFAARPFVKVNYAAIPT